MMYLVTYSDEYYPCGSHGDWVKIFKDYTEATHFANGYADAKSSMGNVYIIEIKEDLTFKEVCCIRVKY